MSDMAKSKKDKFEDCRGSDCKARRFTGKEKMSQLGQHILREHPDEAWQLYAQIYLEKMWFGQCEQDKRLVKKFEYITASILDDLDDLFKKYSVARTIPGDGTARYKRFAEMLSRYRETEMKKENVPGIVELEGENLRQPFAKPRPHTRRPISAITKSLWMTKQHPIVIYDGNTWEGLRRREKRLLRPDLAPGDSYTTYYNAWFKFFEENQTGLEAALQWLPESPAAKKIIEAGRASADDIIELAEKPLMRNRVADMRLFYEGGGFLEDSLSCNSQGSCRNTGDNNLTAA